MNFKTKEAQLQYEKLPKILKKICEDFEAMARLHGIIPVVTRVASPVNGESGVHTQFRAIDFRDQFGPESYCYPEEVRKEIIEGINAKYARKDKFKTVVWHSFKGAPYHFHIQVPANPELFLHQEIIDECF